MALAVVTLKSFEPSRRFNKWHYKAVMGSDNYATGGRLIDLTAAIVPAGQEHAVPDFFPKKYQVNFHNSCAGYTPEWVEGTTLANGYISLYSPLTAAELAATTMPSGCQTAELDFTISMPRGKSQ